jgi:hypothetical protein
VLKVLWSQSHALLVNGKTNSVLLNAWSVSKVTSVLMVPFSPLLALMVNTTPWLAQFQMRTALAAQPVATAFKVPTSLGSAPQALTRNSLVRPSAVTALLAVNAGSPVWFLPCLAPLVPSRLMDNA